MEGIFQPKGTFATRGPASWKDFYRSLTWKDIHSFHPDQF